LNPISSATEIKPIAIGIMIATTIRETAIIITVFTLGAAILINLFYN
jgi:hypothetical protein